DVADDAADSGGRTFVRFDVGGAVVTFGFEGDGPAVADVDDACVLADTDEHVRPHFVGGGVSEVAQVLFGGFVGAVFAPHHRVHRQFGVGGSASEDFPDADVFVVGQSELGVGLVEFGRVGRVCSVVNSRRLHAAEDTGRGDPGVVRWRGFRGLVTANR